MNDINDIIQKLKGAEAQASLSALKSKLNSPEGQQIKEKLKGLDKMALLQSMSRMDSSKVPSGADLGKAANDPDLLRKLNAFIESQK